MNILLLFSPLAPATAAADDGHNKNSAPDLVAAVSLKSLRSLLQE